MDRKIEGIDLGNMTAIQDIGGIAQKYVSKNNAAAVSSISTGASVNVESLIERTQILLDDSEYNEVKKYCAKILEFSPREDRAYWMKLQAEFKLNGKTIQTAKQMIWNTIDYKHAIEYAPAERKKIYHEVARNIQNNIIIDRKAEKVRLEKELQNLQNISKAENDRFQNMKERYTHDIESYRAKITNNDAELDSLNKKIKQDEYTLSSLNYERGEWKSKRPMWSIALVFFVADLIIDMVASETTSNVVFIASIVLWFIILGNRIRTDVRISVLQNQIPSEEVQRQTIVKKTKQLKCQIDTMEKEIRDCQDNVQKANELVKEEKKDMHDIQLAISNIQAQVIL